MSINTELNYLEGRESVLEELVLQLKAGSYSSLEDLLKALEYELIYCKDNKAICKKKNTCATCLNSSCPSY